MPPPPHTSSDADSADDGCWKQQQQQRLWRLHCMCASLVETHQDQEGAATHGLLYFVEDVAEGWGGTWSVEAPSAAESAVESGRQVQSGFTVLSDPAERSLSSLPPSTAAPLEIDAVADSMDAWDDADCSNMSLSYWSHATSTHMPSSPTAAPDSALPPSSQVVLPSGTRAFLGFSDSPSAGAIAKVGLPFPGWGDFRGASKEQLGKEHPWA
jgi:hypothetical protein